MADFYIVRAVVRDTSGRSNVVTLARTRIEAVEHAREQMRADAVVSIISAKGEIFSSADFEEWFEMAQLDHRNTAAA